MDADACGFVSRADWYLRWPFIRDGIDSLVVLSEEDGSISRETWLELRDAMDSGLSCWFVTADGDLVHPGVDRLPALSDPMSAPNGAGRTPRSCPSTDHAPRVGFGGLRRRRGTIAAPTDYGAAHGRPGSLH